MNTGLNMRCVSVLLFNAQGILNDCSVCVCMCAGHAGGVTGPVHHVGEEDESRLWGAGKEIPQGQETHQGVPAEVGALLFCS